MRDESIINVTVHDHGADPFSLRPLSGHEPKQVLDLSQWCSMIITPDRLRELHAVIGEFLDTEAYQRLMSVAPVPVADPVPAEVAA